MNRTCFAALVVFIGLSCQSFAASTLPKHPSGTETAKVFLELSGFDAYHKSTLNLPATGFAPMDAMFDVIRKGPEFQRLQEQMLVVLPKVRDKMAETYAEKFSASELLALSKFFKSPVGAKYASLYPEMNRLAARALFEETMRLNPKVTEALEAENQRKEKVESDRVALEQKANEGNPEAMYKLANTTYCFRQETLGQCFAWKLKAAEAGFVEAQFDVGMSYATGRYGNQKSGEEMFNWMVRAAEKGHVMAAYNVGSAYAGNLKAFGNQAVGVEVSAKNAEEWLKKAASSGGMQAIMDIAAMYLEGRVLERNPQQGIYWYSQAAEKRNTLAMKKLGELYERGLGVEPNQTEAIKWYKLAAGIPK